MNSTEVDLKCPDEMLEILKDDKEIICLVKNVRIYLFNDWFDGVWLISPIAIGGTVVNSFLVSFWMY